MTAQSTTNPLLLRPSVSDAAFDAELFAELRGALVRGELGPARVRLPRAPAPLTGGPPLYDLSQLGAAERARLRDRGEQALRAGEVAVLVLNGGMATRFGGVVKGVVSVVPGRPDISFLAVKLAGLRASGVPVVLMQSFATAAATAEHLAAIGWAGVSPVNRLQFSQSIFPRVLPDGTPLPVLPDVASLSDTQIYAAAGHGDSLRRILESGTADILAARGVAHVLVSNVDNLGAALDTHILGAHLEAVDRGHAMSVEAVQRQPGDAGGCVAEVGGRAIIVEGFRLPDHTDLADYPHFNTNTLWISLAAMREVHPLQWFAVRRTIPWSSGETREVIQFEQLIGQLSEFVSTACLLVDRTRFLPIKTREDLARAAPRLAALARAAGLCPDAPEPARSATV
jgi:UTP--glucose-1-phosphate uridylyltransferase